MPDSTDSKRQHRRETRHAEFEAEQRRASSHSPGMVGHFRLVQWLGELVGPNRWSSGLVLWSTGLAALGALVWLAGTLLRWW